MGEHWIVHERGHAILAPRIVQTEVIAERHRQNGARVEGPYVPIEDARDAVRLAHLHDDELTEADEQRLRELAAKYPTDGFASRETRGS